MAEFSEKMAATALRLITKYGEEATISFDTSGVMTSSGDRPVINAPSSVRIAMFPSDGDELQENETKRRKVYLGPLEPPPQAGQRLRISAPSLNAGVWQIKKASSYAPQGQIIYSELEVEA